MHDAFAIIRWRDAGICRVISSVLWSEYWWERRCWYLFSLVLAIEPVGQELALVLAQR